MAPPPVVPPGNVLDGDGGTEAAGGGGRGDAVAAAVAGVARVCLRAGGGLVAQFPAPLEAPLRAGPGIVAQRHLRGAGNCASNPPPARRRSTRPPAQGLREGAGWGKSPPQAE
ncbi:hypothetical protein GCM10010278_74180 [Streptomyces melanogenes]|nr:hypothetical protein GCM10010278_74180 [Streptomyces melanogenes]